MRRPPVLRRVLWVLLATAALVAGVQFLPACGPSELARAFDPFRSAIDQRFDDEKTFLLKTEELSQDLSESGLQAFRRHLDDAYATYYAEMERAVGAIEPGHPRLAEIRTVVQEYVRLRREAGVIERQRVDLLLPRAKGVGRVMQLQEDQDTALKDYHEAVTRADGVPDPRYSELIGTRDSFLVAGPYARAVAGTGEPSAAADLLTRTILPRLAKLRADRFEDTKLDRLLRSAVVVSEEFYQALAAELPTQIAVAKANGRIDAVRREIGVVRSRYVKLMQEAQRDR